MIRKINVGSGTCCNYAKKGRDLAIQFAYGTIKAKHLRNKNSLSLKNIKSVTKEVIVYRIIFSWNVIDGFIVSYVCCYYVSFVLFSPAHLLAGLERGITCIL